MPEKKRGKFCHLCLRQTLHTAPGINHILHLFLTIFTGGLWAIVWSMQTLIPSRFCCSQCGAVYSWSRSRKARKQVQRVEQV